jgi:hypothetical protein
MDRVARIFVVAGVMALAGAARAGDGAAPWKPVSDAIGRPGELQKDGSFKVTLLRTDVAVKTARGMPVPTGLGLNSYAAFAGTPERAAVVGDMCLLAAEVEGVIDALRAGGIEVIALHNHMLSGEPQLLFLHFQGSGDARGLAKTLRGAFDRIGKAAPPPAAPPPAPASAGAKEIDWGALARILGRDASMAGDGTGKFTLPRADLEVKLAGTSLTPGVGLACWAAFAACPCGETMVMGDTCVKPGELQGAIDTLRRGGVSVSGIHNHMLGEKEEVMFLHFEGEGDAAALARTIRAVWDGLDVSKQGK